MGFATGIGGFERAAESAGLPVAGTCEINKDARTVSFLATGKHPLGDLFRLKPDDLPHAEIYVAGFSCRPFSQLGPMTGFTHREGLMVFQIILLAKERRPKIIVFENVPSIRSHNGGQTLEVINSALVEAGYRPLEWRILNSAHWGVPTARRRWFAISFRADLDVQPIVWPNPRKPAATVRSILLPEHLTQDLIVSSREFIRDGRKTPRPDEYSPLYVGYIKKKFHDRMVWSPDAPAPTFTSGTGGGGGASGMYLIDGRIKKLHTLEMLACMKFGRIPMPFRGATGARLVGNALVPAVAADVLRAALIALTGEEFSS
jgi:DNA (cytosine-5)-methyltransferase 1